jgi:hypothetical protein
METAFTSVKLIKLIIKKYLKDVAVFLQFGKNQLVNVDFKFSFRIVYIIRLTCTFLANITQALRVN